MVWRAKNAWKEAGSASVGSAHLIGGFGERTGSVFLLKPSRPRAEIG